MENEIENKKEKYVPKTLALIAFIIIIATIFLSLISYTIIFHEAIITYLSALFICMFTFLFLFIVMIISFIVVFGIPLVQMYGFWPAKITSDLYHNIIGDILITKNQIQLFKFFSLIFVLFALSTFALAIIAFIKDKQEKENGTKPNVVFKPFAIIALILSILASLSFLGAFGLSYII